MVSSRIPGFYELPLAERRQQIEEALGLDPLELQQALDDGGLLPRHADKIVENVLGTYALPFSIALNFVINEQDRFVPMVVEEPSVVAAASNAAKMVRGSGGFFARMENPLMIAQIELRRVRDVSAATLAIAEHKAALLQEANDSLPGLKRRGGGVRDLEVRNLAEDHLVVHLLVDCLDAMGANLVNTAAEHIGPRLAELTDSTLGLRILSNLADRRVVTVEARVDGTALSAGGQAGDPGEILEAIEAASVFAERDSYRAATHNKGIMNGVDSVVIATGNDYRAVEAGAHAYAARGGRYTPLATWRREGEDLLGKLEMPLALGTVGGTLRVHPTARLALRIAGAQGATDLAFVAASAGLASNLAAVRALATEGIQRGHMALHARSVAIAVGAVGKEVELVAARLAGRRVGTDEAEKALREIRQNQPESRS